MTEHGPAFYGSDELYDKLYEVLDGQIGKWKSKRTGKWKSGVSLTFRDPNILYKLSKNHWFYDTDEFKRAKKPTCNDNLQVPKPLADYSEDELQNKIKSMQAEIERRKAKDDEILKLARKVCADNHSNILDQCTFLEGKCDNWRTMKVAKAAIIAGMELKGRET